MRLACSLVALLCATNALAQEALPACDPAATPLLLTEVAVSPDGAEFVEVFNPGAQPVRLDGVYLTDATFARGGERYPHIVTGKGAGGGSYGDFHAIFPPGAILGAQEAATIAIDGSRSFRDRYGVLPTYELLEDDPAPDTVPDMRPARVGSISIFGDTDLEDGGEVLVLYCWDGLSDRVADLDYVLWGDTHEAVSKTETALDGPDGDAKPTPYAPDVPEEAQLLLAERPHEVGASWQRGDPSEGSERHADGNGLTGHDETSEDLAETWFTAAPTPGRAEFAAPSLPVSVTATPARGVRPDSFVTWVIRVRNDSALAARDVDVAATLPDGVRMHAWIVSPAGSVVDGSVMTWSGTIPGETELVWALVTEVDASEAPGEASVRVVRPNGEDTANGSFTREVPAVVDAGSAWGGDTDDEPDTAPTQRVEVTNRAQIGLETRAFPNDDDEVTEDIGASLVARLQTDAKLRRLRTRALISGRFDQFDAERRILNIQELWVEARLGVLRLRGGVDTVNWSRMEAFHPADVLNSRFLDSRIENPDKLGEPMVGAKLLGFGGSLNVMFLPAVIAPVLPSSVSRQSFVPGVELGDPVWLRPDGSVVERFAPQGGAFAERTFGSADLSVHVLQHQDRSQPLIVFDSVAGEVRPLYQTVRQVGGTYNHAIGPMVAKAETVYRDFRQGDDAPSPYGPLPDRDHVTAAVGVEYGGGWGRTSSNLLLEAQFLRQVRGDAPDWASQLSFFEQDVLAGWRWALNDASDRSILALAIVDVRTFEDVLATVRYNQRVGQAWIFECGLRLLEAPAREADAPLLLAAGLAPLRRADMAWVHLARHF